MKHLLASAALGALLLAPASVTMAETPDDQLVVGFNMNNVLTLDPAAITGADAVQILNNVYDTIVRLDPQTRELIPSVAESWEISEDNRSITFHIDPDATFASGNPVTAEDVAYSLRRPIQLNLAQSTWLVSRGYTADNIEEMTEVVDNKTLRLHLPQPDDPRLVMMTLTINGPGSILDKTLVEEHAEDDMGTAWLTNNSAGSGAFTLNQWRANEFVILTRNEDYWGDAPEMARVLMRHLPESQSQRLALEQGDLDIGYSLAAADLRALEENEDIIVETVPSAGFYYLAVSMKNEILADKKVREALRYLIDYDGINDAIMPYFGTKRQVPINSYAFAAAEDPGYELDVERAKELLAEAGYPDGFDTTLRVISTQQFIDSATAIQATLKQAGINAEIITGDGGQIYGAMRSREFDLLVGRGGGGVSPHPDSNLRAVVYNPDNSDDAGLTNYQGWRTSFYDEELNGMIEDALVEGDVETQRQMYSDIQNYMQDAVISIQPFSERVVTAAFQSDVDGVIVDVWSSRFEDVTKDR
ncbi:ABC transporter substrate-binding protein [Allosediminivita pacifica]|uniref:Peptide/nickel transport system substrate-binding protein n=1 Tax=Allosediminivita pacifica TaxID=1267769 RepID=A0A2T6AJG1_9RHOB|nr:ABC transporter substrate-binding protein [Allosediminivita pacifica]PTX43955.1 peptide/nickel transport system substrate-binding protein [Allosediminivita pacifica]GGB21393.1 peptide ABC transporter substrate-binding protein [Allosediminivita pacifica]